jgi:hypothetical protein
VSEEQAAGTAAEAAAPGWFRAAAGNLVREDDPVAVAFRELAGRIVKLSRALTALKRVSDMHCGYRHRQLARRRRRP